MADARPPRPRCDLDGRRRLGAVGLARRRRRCATRSPPCSASSRLRTVELTTNYRTSTEIAALAARLLARIDPALQPPAAVRSTGVEPLLVDGRRRCAEVPAAVERLLGQVGGTVGVVAPHGLVERGPRRAAGDPRLSVVDPWQVKGLEYDGCVVADPHGLVAEAQHPVAGLRSLYVALTRATQRLVVVSREPLETLLSP